MSSIAKLLGISMPISNQPAELPCLHQFLTPIYSKMNGIFAFESSLLVLPTINVGMVPSLDEWNASCGWRSHYDVPDDILFFGMDAFAGQFGIGSWGVVRLEPEAGGISRFANDLEGWAGKILDNYDFETGFSIAHDWQVQHEPLKKGMRLLPKKPFTLGGDFSAENLTPWPIRGAMLQLVNLHRQIGSVPDGKAIKISGWLVHSED